MPEEPEERRHRRTASHVMIMAVPGRMTAVRAPVVTVVGAPVVLVTLFNAGFRSPAAAAMPAPGFGLARRKGRQAEKYGCSGKKFTC